jgi:hypothetical protein
MMLKKQKQIHFDCGLARKARSRLRRGNEKLWPVIYKPNPKDVGENKNVTLQLA